MHDDHKMLQYPGMFSRENPWHLAKELVESSSLASNVWLQRFNSRHYQSLKKLCIEATIFDNSSSLKKWKDVVL